MNLNELDTHEAYLCACMHNHGLKWLRGTGGTGRGREREAQQVNGFIDPVVLSFHADTLNVYVCVYPVGTLFLSFSAHLSSSGGKIRNGSKSFIF